MLPRLYHEKKIPKCMFTKSPNTQRVYRLNKKLEDTVGFSFGLWEV